MRTLCTSGKILGHSLWCRPSSDMMARKARSSPLPRRSIPALPHGVCGNVKWCGTRNPLATILSVFLKWVVPSDMRLYVTPNAPHQSKTERREFSADVSGNGNSHQKLEWSSRSVRTYFSPESAGSISTYSIWIRSIAAVPWTSGPYGRSTFSLQRWRGSVYKWIQIPDCLLNL